MQRLRSRDDFNQRKTSPRALAELQGTTCGCPQDREPGFTAVLLDPKSMVILAATTVTQIFWRLHFLSYQHNKTNQCFDSLFILLLRDCSSSGFCSEPGLLIAQYTKGLNTKQPSQRRLQVQWQFEFRQPGGTWSPLLGSH